MDSIYLIILRLVHIFSGIFWVGSAILLSRFMLPAVRQLGADGSKYLWGFYKYTPFGTAIAVSAGLTSLAGILLYLHPGNVAAFSQIGQIVLSIGALAGLGAAGHGGAVLGRLSAQYVALLDKTIGQNKAPTQQETAEIQGLGAKLGQHTQISLILMVIAVIGMASARYL